MISSSLSSGFKPQILFHLSLRCNFLILFGITAAVSSCSKSGIFTFIMVFNAFKITIAAINKVIKRAIVAMIKYVEGMLIVSIFRGFLYHFRLFYYPFLEAFDSFDPHSLCSSE